MFPPCPPGGTECGRSDPHDAEEGPKRETRDPVVVLVGGQRHDTPAHSVHAFFHTGEHAERSFLQGKLAGKRTATVSVGDDTVRDPRFSLDQGHAQQVTGLGAANGDGAGDDVRAVGLRVAKRPVRREGHRVAQHPRRGHTVSSEELDGIASLVLQHSLVADRVDDDVGAGLDRQHRRIIRARQPSPHHRSALCRHVGHTCRYVLARLGRPFCRSHVPSLSARSLRAVRP